VRGSSRTVIGLLLAWAAGCSRPEPPTLSPEGARITSISTAGIDVEVRVDATNPNDHQLSAAGVKARILLDGALEVGAVISNQPIELPAKKRAVLDIPFSVKWADPGPLAALAESGRSIGYDVDGSVEFHGAGAVLQTPFKIKGTLSHDDLVRATQPPAPPPPPAAPTASASASPATKPKKR
jgi:hypothetical protein